MPNSMGEWADAHTMHGDFSENEDCPMCLDELECSGNLKVSEGFASIESLAAVQSIKSMFGIA